MTDNVWITINHNKQQRENDILQFPYHIYTLVFHILEYHLIHMDNDQSILHDSLLLTYETYSTDEQTEQCSLHMNSRNYPLDC